MTQVDGMQLQQLILCINFCTFNGSFKKNYITNSINKQKQLPYEKTIIIMQTLNNKPMSCLTPSLNNDEQSDGPVQY